MSSSTIMKPYSCNTYMELNNRDVINYTHVSAMKCQNVTMKKPTHSYRVVWTDRINTCGAVPMWQRLFWTLKSIKAKSKDIQCGNGKDIDPMLLFCFQTPNAIQHQPHEWIKTDKFVIWFSNSVSSGVEMKSRNRTNRLVDETLMQYSQP